LIFTGSECIYSDSCLRYTARAAEFFHLYGNIACKMPWEEP
jgi:hypothetical protein